MVGFGEEIKCRVRGAKTGRASWKEKEHWGERGGK